MSVYVQEVLILIVCVHFCSPFFRFPKTVECRLYSKIEGQFLLIAVIPDAIKKTPGQHVY